MGRVYKREKRARKFQHVHALLKACEHLGVRLIGSWLPLTVSRAAKCGCKRLGWMREQIIQTADEQGVDTDLLYSMARQYTTIPRFSVREHRVTKVHALPAPVEPVAQLESISVRSFASTRGPCLRCETPLRYGTLSPVHLSLGDGFLERLRGMFNHAEVEQTVITFPRYFRCFEQSGDHEWRSFPDAAEGLLSICVQA
jgi:hypothetical protein